MESIPLSNAWKLSPLLNTVHLFCPETREGAAGGRMRARDTVSYLAYLVLHARSVAPIRIQGEPLVFDENRKAADQKNR